MLFNFSFLVVFRASHGFATCIYIFMKMDGQSCTFVSSYQTHKLLRTPWYLVFYQLYCTFSHFYIMHSFGYLEKERKEILFLYKEVYIRQYKIHKMVLEG